MGNLKLSQDFVENEFFKTGCKLLDIYVNNSTPMKYICSCGQESVIRWMSFKTGSRCNLCKGTKIRSSKQLNFEDVKKFFSDNQCKLLETEYINSNTSMKYICHCGNESKIQFKHFKNGVRCFQCGLQKQRRFGPENHYWIPDRDYVKQRELFSRKCICLLQGVMKRINLKKNDHTQKILGYSKLEFQKHILSHPDYELAIANNDLTIDHIFPVKAFVEHGLCQEEHLPIVNCLENLRPLDRKLNSSKGKKYDPEKFIEFLLRKNVVPLENPYNIDIGKITNMLSKLV
jgi:hypothetical protein